MFSISSGHPIGATGLAQCAELNWQVLMFFFFFCFCLTMLLVRRFAVIIPLHWFLSLEQLPVYYILWDSVKGPERTAYCTERTNKNCNFEEICSQEEEEEEEGEGEGEGEGKGQGGLGGGTGGRIRRRRAPLTIFLLFSTVTAERWGWQAAGRRGVSSFTAQLWNRRSSCCYNVQKIQTTTPITDSCQVVTIGLAVDWQHERCEITQKLFVKIMNAQKCH